MFLFDEVDFVRTQAVTVSELWYFLPIGYLTTILIETPILFFGLSPKLTARQKLACGVWLTACTYPIVILVLGALFFNYSRAVYLVVAETFAPVAECLFFWLALRGRNLFEKSDWMRCFTIIVLANLASFGLGEILHLYSWFGLF